MVDDFPTSSSGYIGQDGMRDTDCVSDINALDRHQQFPDTRRGSQIHADWPN